MQIPEEITKLPEWHPLNQYTKEVDLLQKTIWELRTVKAADDAQLFFNFFNKLNTIEKRFERKENQLFPYLEKRGWDGPSQNMWSFHDNLRDQFRLLRTAFENKDFEKVDQNIHYLLDGINNLLAVEQSVLFPNALDILQESDWKEMRAGEKEIGWMPGCEPSPKASHDYVHPSEDKKVKDLSFLDEKSAHYDEGYMTVEQVNLLFKTIPVDITYVDENDKVIFYNRGEERVFPRSAGIIGREVKFCHPPKSVGKVLKILEAFREGSKSEASFWINFKGRLVYIRYFAVRDKQKYYKGVVEMSQDITDIKDIEGEKRLLEWS
jgi:PAS domain S-box-containing protein